MRRAWILASALAVVRVPVLSRPARVAIEGPSDVHRLVGPIACLPARPRA